MLAKMDLKHAITTTRTFLDRELYDFDPPYQRGRVWGLARKKNLIRSVLLGVPLGAVTINARWEALGLSGLTDTYGPDAALYAVIDGKQRITTLLGFFADEFTVPAAWFGPEQVAEDFAYTEDAEVAFSELGIGTQRNLRNNTVLPTYTAVVPTLADEEMIFDLINNGGLPQGQTDPDA